VTDRRLTRLFAHEMADRLRAGEFSARELLDAHLEWIGASDSGLHAWLWTDEARARGVAARADAMLGEARRGGPDALLALPPLVGVPVALKDLVVTTGQSSTSGSRILQGFVGPYDAHIAERIEAALAPVPGKTNMDEFAMGSSTEHSAYGPTSNPWDLDRVPGGSSGGSAASVAAYQVPLSIGTDTGGSIRQPAALCGIVGLKPTYGSVSRYGMIAFASSLDQAGPLTRDVRDAALMLSHMVGWDHCDATSLQFPGPIEVPAAELLGGVRLGVPAELTGDGIEAGVKEAFDAALRQAEGLGAELLQVSLPHAPQALAAYYVLAPAEASSNLARFDGVRYGLRAENASDLLDMYTRTRHDGFGPEVKRRIMLGTYALSSGYYDAYYGRAQKVRTKIAEDFAKAFETVDFIVTPTAPSVAFALGEKTGDPVAMYLSDYCTVPMSLAGIPAVSIPCGLSGGLPVGLQLAGAAFSENALLDAAHALEAAFEFDGSGARV
jgi:aspartyl-tRNA(Asn)/glutamyl-tRNA(Gln) amidotransferase subunit A